jgi:Cu-processing system permease protein
MRAIIAITLREILQKKILLVTIILTLVFLALYGTALHYAHQSITQISQPAMEAMLASQLLAAGLYVASFIVAFLAVFAGVSSISGEIEHGTIYALVPKPIKRRAIVLGKFLGLGLILVIYSSFFIGSILLLVRQFLGFQPGNILAGIALFSLQPLILLAVSLLGSTLLPTLGNGITIFLLYSIAIIGGMVEQIGVLLRNHVLVNTGIVASLILPVDSIYRKVVQLLLASSGNFLNNILGPFGSGSTPSIWMIVYSLIYLGGTLALSIAIFNKRDL